VEVKRHGNYQETQNNQTYNKNGEWKHPREDNRYNILRIDDDDEASLESERGEEKVTEHEGGTTREILVLQIQQLREENNTLMEKLKNNLDKEKISEEKDHEHESEEKKIFERNKTNITSVNVELMKQVEVLDERFEVEMMTVNSLERYLKTLEEDYTAVISESDATIQKLKQERHDLKIQAHYKSKESEIDKMEVGNLKKRLAFYQQNKQEIETVMKKTEDEKKKLKDELLTMQNNKAESDHRVKELQATVEAMECCINELKAEAQEQEERNKQYHKEMKDLTQQIHVMKDVEEKLKSKENEQEVATKTINQLRHDVNNLEYSLRMKQNYSNRLEEQLSRCGNIEIESIFKRKTRSKVNQNKRYEECKQKL